MRTTPILAVALVGSALFGCASASPAPTVPGESLSAEQLAITEQTLTGFTAEARMELANPGDAQLQVVSASWQLTLDGKPLTSGTTDIDRVAEPGQSLNFRVPASAEIIHDADELKGFLARGDQPIELVMKGSLKVSQAAQTREIPFSRAGSLRAPQLPIPKMNDVQLGRADDDVTISFYLGLDNQNPFEVKVKAINYRAEVDGKEVGSGVASTGDHLPPSQTAEYPIQENIQNLDRSKSSLAYHLTGSVELGLVQVPIDLQGNVVFSNKQPKPKAKAKKSAE